MQETRSGVLFRPATVAALVGALLTSIVLLMWNGRVWWCKEGDSMPWSWDIWTAHNSQHLLDPYSFTHALHGIAEYWLIGLVFASMPAAWRFVVAIAIESTWEVVENSRFIIERYREETISLDYFGDSVANSMADIAFCGMGFIAARALGFGRSAVVFIATELILILTIRDSLIINVIMLLYPVEAIKAWQMAGQ